MAEAFFSIIHAVRNPMQLQDMSPSALYDLIKSHNEIGHVDKRKLHGYMVKMYHYWGNVVKDPVAELFTRLIYELVIGKLNLCDVVESPKWRRPNIRDAGHTMRIGKLLKVIKKSKGRKAELEKCRWLCTFGV